MQVINGIRRSGVGVRPEQTIREAATIMERSGVGALAVVDGEHLVGLITDRDLVRRGRPDRQPDEHSGCHHRCSSRSSRCVRAVPHPWQSATSGGAGGAVRRHDHGRRSVDQPGRRPREPEPARYGRGPLRPPRQPAPGNGITQTDPASDGPVSAAKRRSPVR